MKSIISFLQNYNPFKKRSSTVRHMFPALATFAALLGAAVVTTSDVSFVRLESSVATVEAGDRFTMQVYANAHVPVNAIDVTLEFDDVAVEVIEVDIGQSVLTIWTEDPVVKGNTVVLRGGTFRKGFLGEHLIASIDLRAAEAGQGTFEVSNVLFLAGDGAGTNVAVAESSDSKVNFFVYDENTDPSEIALNVRAQIITDIDGNGKVDLTDISSFMAAWSSKDTLYDFNNDGRMTFRDFSIILADFFLK